MLVEKADPRGQRNRMKELLRLITKEWLHEISRAAMVVVCTSLSQIGPELKAAMTD